MNTPKSAPQALIIGAGVGGMVSAIYLAKQGVRVKVLEKEAEVGGKMRQINIDGHGIDSGPTVLTMRWVFEQIFSDAGSSLERELTLTALPVLARHAWAVPQDEEPQTLNLYADARASFDAVANFAGLAEAKRFERFCKASKTLYRHLEGPIMREATPSITKLVGALGPRGLLHLASIGPMRSLWESLGGYFKDSRLRQLFARYATYCGSSPWLAPATLMLIAQVEMDGVWAVRGGMFALAQALKRLAHGLGVEFFNERYVQEILTKGEGNRRLVHGVVCKGGERFDCDVVVFNGDVQALYSGLLGDSLKQWDQEVRAADATGTISAQLEQKRAGEKHILQNPQTPNATRSLSAITWSMRSSCSGFELNRHNVFFEKNYEREFKDIFEHGRLPRSPTVYVCAQNRGLAHHEMNPGDMKPGAEESLLCLVNAPAIADSRTITQGEIEQCQEQAFTLLSRCGLQINQSSLEAPSCVRSTPEQFHQLFPATGGALYGQATHGWMQVFSRANARSSKIAGLIPTGGSVHPGPGVPMAAISGQLAGAAAMAHLALIKQ